MFSMVSWSLFFGEFLQLWRLSIGPLEPKVLSHAGVVLNYSTMVTAHDERAFWQKDWQRWRGKSVANDGFYRYIMSILVV